MDVTDQVMHDWLLQCKPDTARHEPSECAFCTQKASIEEMNVTAELTLTHEQHTQLLESAVSDAVATAKAEVDAEILRLNELLEEAGVTTSEKDEEIANLKASIAERDEAERLEALANKRVVEVAEVASFSDEQVEARRNDWAEMSDEAFGKYVADLEVAAKAAIKPKEENEKLPKTKFDGTRETAGDEGTEGSVIESLFAPAIAAAARS